MKIMCVKQFEDIVPFQFTTKNKIYRSLYYFDTNYPIVSVAAIYLIQNSVLIQNSKPIKKCYFQQRGYMLKWIYVEKHRLC